jgi:hypothetical protein
MSIRLPLIAVVSVLSGCALSGCSLLSTLLNESGCRYGVLPQSYTARCMTYSEYKAAREGLRNNGSNDESVAARHDSGRDWKSSWANQTIKGIAAAAGRATP